MEQCGNCERPIGNLETPFVWRERVVCGECHGRLSDAADLERAVPVIAYATPSGLPIAGGNPPAMVQPMAVLGTPPPLVQTIERTSKDLKLFVLVGWIGTATGLFCLALRLFLSYTDPSHYRGESGGSLAFAGVALVVPFGIMLVITKVEIWWKHG